LIYEGKADLLSIQALSYPVLANTWNSVVLPAVPGLFHRTKSLSDNSGESDRPGYHGLHSQLPSHSKTALPEKICHFYPVAVDDDPYKQQYKNVHHWYDPERSGTLSVDKSVKNPNL
jgi:hypothetical protein